MNAGDVAPGGALPDVVQKREGTALLSRIRGALAKPEETDIEKKPAKASLAADVKPLAYHKLYRGLTAYDYGLLLFGIVGAIGAGATLPGFTILFGGLVNAFNPTSGDVNAEISAQVNSVCLKFVWIGLAAGLASHWEVWAFMSLGVRISNRLRKRYLQAALKQDVGFYDVDASTGVLLQGLNEDSNAVQTATGEKVGQFVHHMATFIGGIAVAFWKGWKLTLVMMSVLPLLALLGVAMGSMMAKLSTKASNAYGKANEIVQQALSNIRTVMAFNGQEITQSRYRAALAQPQQVAIRSGVLQGLTLGSLMGVMFCTYALALWYGGTRVRAGDMNGGQVLTVLFSVLMGGFSLGQAAPLLQHFIGGKTAGARVWSVIEREPKIADAADAQPLTSLSGSIELSGVRFSYPSRPDVQIFSGLDLYVAAGQTVALVGESGSGKSSVVSLVMRYYDPSSGAIKLDGHDIRSLPLSWLRKQIGLVSQEPVLFQTSIFNNIKYGLPEATAEQVYAAAKAANAHSFIQALPNGYDTLAGEAGAQVSGGQKQRIAIARAILKSPKILLLDEATSALDSTSERVVQKALETLMPGRTNIVVAHRLSTVKSFHIAVMKQGRVVEVGTHADLISRPGGAYATLVKLQQQRKEQGGDEADAQGAEEQLQEELGSCRSLMGPQGSEKTLQVDGYAAKPVAKSWRQRLPWAKKERAEDKPQKQVNAPFSRLLRLNKPEMVWAAFGCLASAVLGAQMPAFSIALSSIIVIYYQPFDTMKTEVAKWCGVFVAIGVGTFLATAVQQLSFALMGAKLARRVRSLTFAALLRQEVAFFDEDQHSSGALSARLATDASAVRGAVGDQLGLLFQNLVTVIAGFAIAFAYGWRMTLVVLAIVPLLGAAGYLQAEFMVGFSAEADKMFAEANQTASEAFSSIRTVAAFQMEAAVTSLYEQLLVPPTHAALQRARTSGLGFGFSQGVMYLAYALSFWYGGREVSRGQMTFGDVLKVFFAVLLMALGVSQSQMAFPDVSKAKAAIQNIFGLMDRKPRSIDIEAPGKTLSHVEGRIELRSVTFSYPAREIKVFNDFSLTVEAGTTVALVGPSGSGKSTTVALVMRLYDPLRGAVLLDGTDIRTLQLKWLRSNIGVVSQEPVLFSATIAENIRYGRPEATLEEVRAAAHSANAGFVDSLPEGFDTPVGQNGIQLSGGQKQRVAIARALIKEPRILLLDEATSALDATSEATVQVALDAAAAERTTLIIAHRLSTIRNANTIAVVQDGKILERGTHEQLLARPGGSYTQLVRHQQQS